MVIVEGIIFVSLVAILIILVFRRIKVSTKTLVVLFVIGVSSVIFAYVMSVIQSGGS